MKKIGLQKKYAFFSFSKTPSAQFQIPISQQTVNLEEMTFLPDADAENINIEIEFIFAENKALPQVKVPILRVNLPHFQGNLPHHEPANEKLRSQYMKRREKEISIFRDSLDGLDLEKLKQIAHEIKNSASLYGFSQLGLIARDLEESAIRSDLGKLDELINQFEECVSSSQIHL